jgi:hypothetical protein
MEAVRPLLRILRSRHSHVHVQHGWRLVISNVLLTIEREPGVRSHGPASPTLLLLVPNR